MALCYEEKSCVRIPVINEFGSCIAVHTCKVAVISLMQWKMVLMKCLFFHVMKEQGHGFKSVVIL